MKVLFVLGGVSHYMTALLRKIAGKGCEVVVVHPSAEKSKTIGEGVLLSGEQSGYTAIVAEERNAYYGKVRIEGLSHIIDNEKPDIVIIGWPYMLQLFFEREIVKSIRRNDTKLIIREIPFQTPPYGKIKSYFKAHPAYNEKMELLSTGLSFYIRSFIVMLIRKWCYKRAAATINYASMAYDIIPSYGVKRASIFVTYNSGDNEALNRERAKVEQLTPLLSINPQRILHIGRLVKWKRVDLLIDAFKLVLQNHPDAELTIVGAGPEFDNLKAQAHTLGIADKVMFAGAVYNPITLGQYMNESAIYVLAGMGGLSINDAMCYAMPVICSVCDGTEKDLVTDGENGLYFKEGDANDLAEKITRLLSNPDEIKRMGMLSREVIDNKINIETVSSRFVAAFNHVMIRE